MSQHPQLWWFIIIILLWYCIYADTHAHVHTRSRNNQTTVCVARMDHDTRRFAPNEQDESRETTRRVPILSTHLTGHRSIRRVDLVSVGVRGAGGRWRRWCWCSGGVGGFLQTGAEERAALRGFGQDPGAQGGHWFGLSLKSRAADEMMSLPVFVLAERAAVTRRVASAARLAGLTTAVPTALKERKLWLLFFYHKKFSCSTFTLKLLLPSLKNLPFIFCEIIVIILFNLVFFTFQMFRDFNGFISYLCNYHN